MGTSFSLLFVSPGDESSQKRVLAENAKLLKRTTLILPEPRSRASLMTSQQWCKATSSRILSLFSNLPHQLLKKEAQGGKCQHCTLHYICSFVWPLHFFLHVPSLLSLAAHNSNGPRALNPVSSELLALQLTRSHLFMQPKAFIENPRCVGH